MGGGWMDPDVLALVRSAEHDLRALLRDLEEPSDWEGRTRALVLLQTVAATLLDAARREAEHLSRESGRHVTRREDDPA